MTSKAEIRMWLTTKVTPMGQKIEDCTHMIVACDTFDYEDYPVYVEKGQNVHDVMAELESENMQKVMEVYSFNHDIEAQLNEHRAFHFD